MILYQEMPEGSFFCEGTKILLLMESWGLDVFLANRTRFIFHSLVCNYRHCSSRLVLLSPLLYSKNI